MTAGALTPGSRFLFCVPPHSHALLRYGVQSVTPSHIVYFIESGAAVDRRTGDLLGEVPPLGGPVRPIARERIDAERAWDGVAPSEPVFYSSFEAFQRWQETALVRYGVAPLEARASEVELLRERMIEAHPDRGGSVEAFQAARAAYEAARRR